MAKVGLSKCYAAKYNVSDGGTISYTEGMSIGKAVQLDISVASASDNNFFADNGVAESASEFSSGTLTITNDSMPMAALSLLLGVTVEQAQTPTGTVISVPSEPTAPYVGYGTIAKHIVGSVTKWRGIVLLKTKFNVPGISGNTQGQTIAFEGNQYTASILRSDDAEGHWIKMGDFATEADADTWIRTTLSIAS